MSATALKCARRHEVVARVAGAFVASVILCAGGNGLAAIRLLKPSPGPAMDLDLGTKTSRYYRLDAGRPATVSVTGPGTLKVIVRAVPSGEVGETTPYKVVVTESRHTIKAIETETVPSSKKWKNGPNFASQSRAFHLRVPEGVHHYQFRFNSPSADAAGVRYVYRPSKRTGSQSSLYPSSMHEAITILVKEKPLNYFLAAPSVPVKVRVVGPTSLRIISRLIYRQGDKGRRTYTLHADRDGRAIPGKTLETRKSLTAECVEHPEWNVGQSRTIKVPVPRGVHEYTFRFSGDAPAGAALRFSIPKEDIHNGQ